MRSAADSIDLHIAPIICIAVISLTHLSLWICLAMNYVAPEAMRWSQESSQQYLFCAVHVGLLRLLLYFSISVSLYSYCMFCILYLNCNNTLTPQDADVLKPGKTIWYLEHVPSKMQCFTHTVRRYHHRCACVPKSILFSFSSSGTSRWQTWQELDKLSL